MTDLSAHIDLPESWVWMRLDELAEVRNGVTKGRDLSGFKTIDVPYLRVANVQSGYLDLDVIKTIKIKTEEIDKYRLQPNDILFTEGGDRDKVGRATVWHGEIEPCVHQNHIHCVRIYDECTVDPEWIGLASQLPYARDYFLSKANQTVNLASLNSTSLKAFQIPLPPLEDQRYIINKVKVIRTQIKTGQRALNSIPKIIHCFRQSVLAAAFRGEMTERDPGDEPASILLERIRTERRRRWEERIRAKGKDLAKAVYEEPPTPDTSRLPELPDGWVWTTLDLLLERIEAGHSFKAQGRPAEDGELGVIKVSAMTWGEFLPEENKALLPDTDPSDTYRVCKGDLLISRANTVEHVGAVVLVEQDYPNLLLSDKSLRLVPISAEISKEFLLYALRTRPVRDVFEGEATGVSESMRNISQDKIRSASIALPPLSEQARIIEKMKQASDQSNVIERAMATCVRRLDELEQSALAKAFRGEL